MLSSALQPGSGVFEPVSRAAPPHRFEELDSLRGLAALVVFSSHSILLLARFPPWLVTTLETPAGLFLLGGHQAVILFFLLSGFVLYLPYTRSGRGPRRYLPYAAKRVCRIYLPYLASVVFAVMAYLLVFRSVPPGISVFYSWRPLTHAQMLALIANHILFLGSFHREYLNPSTWSLAEELRISLVFPLLAAALGRYGWRRSLAAAVLVSAAASVSMRAIHHRFPLATLHYAALFVLGAVLSDRRERLVELWRRSGRPLQMLTVGTSLLACAYAPWISGRAPVWFPEEASDWVVALACSTFLIGALSGTSFSRLLRHRHMQHLGRISYSFYLLHVPWLLLVSTLLWNRLPHLAVFCLALVATLISAELFFLWVERPSIALGKHLALLVREREEQLTAGDRNPLR